MITAAGATGDGKPFLILGIDGENVTRLVAGEPIHVPAERLAAMGLPPIELAVHYGRTQDDILADFRRRGLIPPGPNGGGGA
jgi:hypothetical protein